MTEPFPSRDDEIVSAVLDGEATPDEVVRVGADPVLQGRLAELTVVRDLVAAPVTPLDELTRHRLVALAVEVAAEVAADGGADVAADRGRPAPLRGPLPWWRRGTTVGIGSAAAVVVLALLVGPAVLDGGGHDDAGTAASAGDGGAEEDLSIEAFDGEAAPFGGGSSGGDDAVEEDAIEDDAVGDGAGGTAALDSGEAEGTVLDTYPDVTAFATAVRARQGATGEVTEDRTPTWGYHDRSDQPIDEIRLRCGPELVADQLDVDRSLVLQVQAMVDGRRLVALAVAGPDAGPTELVVIDLARCQVVPLP